jgi:hypothetical protein
MAEPVMNGEIAFSEIFDGIPEETFIVDAILEPLCDADFCEDFSSYAFQKLPTFRDNFNYPTQVSADANWDLEGTRVRVNAGTEVTDIDCTKEGVLHQTAFDLGAGVSNEKWVLRFDCEILTTSVPTTNDFSILVNISDSDETVGVLSAQDTITWEHNVQGGTGVDRMLLRWSDGVGILPGTGNNFFVTTGAPTTGSGKFYIEIKRLSATTCIINHYSDASFTTLVDTTGVQIIPSAIRNLRYIRVSTRDDVTSAGAQTAQIDKVEFWNGGQQGDVTFEDGFKQKTVTFDDDFSSYADQTEADASWAIVGTTIRANPTTDVMDWDFDKVGGNRASAFDLGAGTVSDTQWTLRWKQTYDTVGDTSSSANIGNVGLYDSDETRASSQTQDFVTFKFFKGTNTTTTNFIGLQSGDGIILNDGAGDSAFATQKNPVGGTTLYFELKRTSATTYEGNIYSDANYSVLVDTLQETVSATATGLRYIKIQNDDRVAVGGGSFNGTMDDIQFWNGDSTLIRWLGATGNDVGLDTVDKRINFDIPSGVQRDELITFDLQSILDGSNASEDNWTLRFKIITDSITQGVSEQSSSLFVGLDDGLLPANTLGHDFITFGVIIDQGGASPQFGAVSTLRTGDNAQYFGGAIGGSNFPIMWATGTLYVEVKRLSPILAECTLYSDAGFTEVFSTPQQVTIASTLDNLRYIRITTDSSAVANDNPWDGSIDDVEFYDGVSVSKTPVFETKDDDDTFITDNYTNISGTKVGVNTTTQVIDWTSSVAVLYNEGEFNDVFGGVIDTDNWALRFKLDVIASSIGADGTANSLFVGFSDDNTGTAEAVQDYVGLQIFRQATGNTGAFRLMGSDGIAPNLTGGTDTTLIPIVGTYYVETRRTGTTISLRIYSDPDFTQLLESVSEALEVGVTGLRYLKVLVSNRDGSGDHTFDGTIDDMQFWNQQNAVDHENKWLRVDE